MGTKYKDKSKSNFFCVFSSSFFIYFVISLCLRCWRWRVKRKYIHNISIIHIDEYFKDKDVAACSIAATFGIQHLWTSNADSNSLVNKTSYFSATFFEFSCVNFPRVFRQYRYLLLPPCLHFLWGPRGMMRTGVICYFQDRENSVVGWWLAVKKG